MNASRINLASVAETALEHTADTALEHTADIAEGAIVEIALSYLSGTAQHARLTRPVVRVRCVAP